MTCLISEATSLDCFAAGSAFFGAKSASDPSVPIVAKLLVEFGKNRLPPEDTDVHFERKDPPLQMIVPSWIATCLGTSLADFDANILLFYVGGSGVKPTN